MATSKKDIAAITAAVVAVLAAQAKPESKRRGGKKPKASGRIVIAGHPDRSTWTKSMTVAAKAAYLASKKRGNGWPKANEAGLKAAKAAS